MSILSEHSGAAEGAPLPCPSWCGQPSDHDLPVLAVAGQTVRREHVVVLLDDRALGYVAVLRSEDLIYPHGPAVSGPVVVHVEDLPAIQTREQLRGLVHVLATTELVAAGIEATEHERLAGGQR